MDTCGIVLSWVNGIENHRISANSRADDWKAGSGPVADWWLTWPPKGCTLVHQSGTVGPQDRMSCLKLSYTSLAEVLRLETKYELEREGSDQFYWRVDSQGDRGSRESLVSEDSALGLGSTGSQEALIPKDTKNMKMLLKRSEYSEPRSTIPSAAATFRTRAHMFRSVHLWMEASRSLHHKQLLHHSHHLRLHEVQADSERLVSWQVTLKPRCDLVISPSQWI